jgi:hypothetical protein
MRALYNRRLVSVARGRLEQGPVTVQQMVAHLSRLLLVAQCQVYGFHSLHTDIVFLVAAVTPNPSAVQVGFFKVKTP